MDTEPHQRLFTTAFVVRFLTGMWLLKCPKGQFSVLCTQHRGMTFVLLYYPEQRVLLLSRLSLQRLKASVDLQLWQDAQHVRLWMNCGIFFPSPDYGCLRTALYLDYWTFAPTFFDLFSYCFFYTPSSATSVLTYPCNSGLLFFCLYFTAWLRHANVTSPLSLEALEL